MPPRTSARAGSARTVHEKTTIQRAKGRHIGASSLGWVNGPRAGAAGQSRVRFLLSSPFREGRVSFSERDRAAATAPAATAARARPIPASHQRRLVGSAGAGRAVVCEGGREGGRDGSRDGRGTATA